MPLKYTLKRPIGLRIGDHVEYDPEPFGDLFAVSKYVADAYCKRIGYRETISCSTDVLGREAVVAIYAGSNTKPLAIVSQRFA